MKSIHIVFILLLLFLTACGDLDEFNGVLKVTVTTDSAIFGQPVVNPDPEPDNVKYTIPAGILQTIEDPDSAGVFISNDAYTFDGTDPEDVGTMKNFVYLFNALGDQSKEFPVLYVGSTSENNTTITIKNIAPGDYYVVVFYDFNGGGNKENQLNRYDRYTIYNGSDGPGSPIVADALMITIPDCETECTPEVISLSIDSDNTLGRTDTVGKTGRIFRTVLP